MRADLTYVSNLSIQLTITTIDLLNRRNKLFVGIAMLVLQELPKTRTSQLQMIQS